MHPDPEFDQVIGSVYDAALEPESWKQAFETLGAWVGADVFHFVGWDSSTSKVQFDVHTDGIADGIAKYGAYYGNIDPRRLLVSQGPEGHVSACQHHFDESFVSRSEYYQDYLLPWGVRHTLSSMVLKDGDTQMLMGMMRSRTRGAFSDDEIARLERVVPHLGRACKLWLRGQQLHQSLAVERRAGVPGGFAVFGLNRAGHLLYANAIAERMLREQTSLALRNNRLAASVVADTLQLQHAIQRAALGHAAENFSIASSGPLGSTTHFVCVAGVPATSPLAPLMSDARVVVMVRERSQTTKVSAEQLEQLFTLTPAECSVALALIEGKTPEDYAKATGLSMSTVRTHLRAVFAKTDTRGQVEAIRLFQNLPH